MPAVASGRQRALRQGARAKCQVNSNCIQSAEVQEVLTESTDTGSRSGVLRENRLPLKSLTILDRGTSKPRCSHPRSS